MGDDPEGTLKTLTDYQQVFSDCIKKFWVPNLLGGIKTLKARGAEFLTPPFDRGSEIRCFFGDPDGRLLETSEVEEPCLF